MTGKEGSITATTAHRNKNGRRKLDIYFITFYICKRGTW
jgi:hypothetical protein